MQGRRGKEAEKSKELEEVLRKQKNEFKTSEENKLKAKKQVDGYRNQARVLQVQVPGGPERGGGVEAEVGELQKCRIIYSGQEGELNKFLHEKGAFDHKTRDLATLGVMMKQKMADVKKERSMAENRLKEASREQAMERKKVKELEVQVGEMQSSTEA